MNLNEIDFNDLEFQEIGVWPLPVRIGAIVIISVLATALAYFLILKEPLSEYQRKNNENYRLRKEFEDKHHKSANLDAYKEQMSEMQVTFRKLLRQLPSRGQVHALIEDISQQASASGLEFNLIRPERQVNKGFYVELPIFLSIEGNYHGFGEFVSGLSMLPRIVTLHDFNIKRLGDPNIIEEEVKLSMEVEAKTYWYTTNQENN